MLIGENISVGLRALLANPMRSFLTMLGVIVGVASVIAILAFGAGAQQQVIEQIRSIGSNLILVVPGAQSNKGAKLKSGGQASLTEADGDAIKSEVAYVTAVAGTIYRRERIVRGNRNWYPLVQGVTADYFIARDWTVARGRTFLADEEANAAKVLILGKTVADKLFEGTDPLDQTVRIGNLPFTVIGIMTKKGQSTVGSDQDDKVLIPLRTAKIRVFGSSKKKPDSMAYFMVKVSDPAYMPYAEAEIRNLLRQRHRRPQGSPDEFTVQNMTELQENEEKASGILTRMLVAVASVSLLVGGISIMNIMLVSIAERTREIGLRLAVGARPSAIRNQFLVEAVTLSVLGGAIGVIVGTGLSLSIAGLFGWPVVIDTASIVLSLAFAGGAGLLFGIYPAIKAGKINPIEALRYE